MGGGTVQERGEARERGTAYIKKEEKKQSPVFGFTANFMHKICSSL
jgi:hypothetical protein